MKDMKFSVGSGMSLREIADQAVVQMSAIEESEVLASEYLPLMNGMNASIHAVRRKSDQIVFARLIEWGIYSQNTMRMVVHDEPDAFPDYHLAPYSILTKLSPIDNHANLKWRDQSRWKLAQEGAFEAKSGNAAAQQAPSGAQAGNGTGGAGSDAPARERVRANRQEPAQRAQKRAPDQSDHRRLRILIDRTPEPGTAPSTGAAFLKIAGFALEGARSFVKLIAWGVQAASLEADIARAMKEAGGSPISLTVDGAFRMSHGKRTFDISHVVAIAQTPERIPQRTQLPQSDSHNPAQAQSR